MPIPAFDPIDNVLPPHLGNPAVRDHLSPYACTLTDVCGQLATSTRRVAILDGLLRLRGELHAAGLAGFQWLAGSFTEDIEMLDGRDPRDIDVVTFVAQPATPQEVADAVFAHDPVLLAHTHVRQHYEVDHFLVSLGSAPATLVDVSRYWYGLFSHRRDRLWKGLLVAPLGDPADDTAARATLASKP